MPPKDPKVRNFTIKTGVVKRRAKRLYSGLYFLLRLTKEKLMYEKEAQQQSEKVEKMKADGKDEYDIKKQIEVKNESALMIPDCVNRLKKAHEELASILENEKELSELEEYKTAQDVLKDAVAQMTS